MASSENVLSLMPDADDSVICEAYDRAMRPKIPDNLLHLVQNTKKEILRNRLQAMIRLKNNSTGGKLMVDLISDHYLCDLCCARMAKLCDRDNVITRLHVQQKTCFSLLHGG